MRKLSSSFTENLWFYSGARQCLKCRQTGTSIWGLPSLMKSGRVAMWHISIGVTLNITKRNKLWHKIYFTLFPCLWNRVYYYSIVRFEYNWEVCQYNDYSMFLMTGFISCTEIVIFWYRSYGHGLNVNKIH